MNRKYLEELDEKWEELNYKDTVNYKRKQKKKLKHVKENS